MNRNFFTKLLGLFVLLLVFHTLMMEVVLHGMVEQSSGRTVHLLGREALWAGLIALAAAIPLAAWVASRISARMESVVAFARRIAEGDLSARLGRMARTSSPRWRLP